jgi:lipopolysaccharide export LptBFGC system permease protein LptF
MSAPKRQMPNHIKQVLFVAAVLYALFHIFGIGLAILVGDASAFAAALIVDAVFALAAAAMWLARRLFPTERW